MVIYLFYYLLLGFCAIFFSKFKNKKANIIHLLIVFLGIFFIVGFRHPSMGVDLQYGTNDGYIGMYKLIASSSFKDVLNQNFMNFEKGYVIFNKLISYFGNNEQVLLIASAILSLFPICYIYWKYSDNFELSMIVYISLTCFLMTFSGLRQACAIGICFSSFYFIKNRKIIPFVLLVILAYTFHSSAIFFLLAYPIYILNIKKQYRFYTLILVLVVFVFRTQIFNLLAPLIKEDAIPDNNGAITLFLIFILIYVFCCFFIYDNQESSGLLNLFLLAILCQAFGNIYSIAGRIGYYFMPFLGLLLPKTLISMKYGEREITSIVLTIAFVGYGLYIIYAAGNSWAETYPWIPFWSH